MSDDDSNQSGKTFWSNVKLGQLVDAIASLGDRTNQLEKETWRLNDKTSSGDSLWGEVLNKLNQDHNEKKRHCLYNIWYLKRHKIRDLAEKKKREFDRNANDGNDGVIADSENPSIPGENNSVLLPDPSLPLPQQPNTCAHQANNDNNKKKRILVGETSIVFTPDEWKNAFSRTRQ